MTANNARRFMFLLCAVTIISLGFFTSMVKAQSGDETACRLIQDNIKRLACFDGLSDDKIALDKPKVASEVAEAPVKKPAAIDDTSPREIDDIDKRAQALMAKSKKSADPFSGSTPRISGNTSRPAAADSSFGSESLRSDPQENVNEIQTRIITVSKDARGYATITLSNDQVWRLTETTRFSIKEDDLISIEKGVLGAFYFSKPDSNRKLRVKRIK